MAGTVRTRFAPSPTGYMHIGNLRTALYEYLIARSLGGKFILRIEDTDQERLVEGATEVIYKTLQLVGIQHDEGPDVGGDYGPYIQSQRKSDYMVYAKQLIEQGDAYYCFCSKERLSQLKEENDQAEKNNMYDRHCMSLAPEEIQQNLDSGMPFVIRQKMPGDGETYFEDAIFGKISVDNSELEDQILVKSDGLPTYNFANVVDDHLMAITHVVRGSEYLSSTPKYNALYQAFGWEIPTYIHLPVVVKEGGQKISKRAGDASFEDLLEMGYLVEAVVNYIALLGWSPRDNQEFFTLKELETAFYVEGISKSPSTFDYAKLNFFNAEYIRRKSPEEFHLLAEPYIRQAVRNQAYDSAKIARTIQQRTEILKDIPGVLDFYDTLPDYEIDLYTHKKMKTDSPIALHSLELVLPVLSSLRDWTAESIHDALVGLAEQQQLKNSQIMWPVRTAVSGKAVTPGGAVEIAEVLGQAETVRRLEIGMKKLRDAMVQEG